MPIFLFMIKKNTLVLKKDENVHRYAVRGEKRERVWKFKIHGSYVRYGMLRIRITKK